MTVTKRDRLEFEQHSLEIEVEFWRRQQEQTRDMDYWHYAEGQMQVLNERLDGIRRKLEG